MMYSGDEYYGDEITSPLERPVRSAVITVDQPGLTKHTITVRTICTAQLVEHDTGSNIWYALLIEGQYYDLVMWKHTIGRPELIAALNRALAQVQTAIQSTR